MKYVALGTVALAATTAFSLDQLGLLRPNFPAASEFPVWGIDVSHHQGPIAWDEVAHSGAKFAYIKATEGGDFVDPRFQENWVHAKDAGIPRGAYHFFTLCRTGDAQAENFMSVVPSDPEALRPVVDLEFGGNCSKRPPRDRLLSELSEFLRRVSDFSGKRPILYVTYEFYEAYGVPPEYDHALWVRDVFGRPRIERDRWLIWQYHCRGRVSGIRGPVDLNAASSLKNVVSEWNR